MNKLNSSSHAGENKIEELFMAIQPIPGEQFHKKMAQAPWRKHSSVIRNHQVRAVLVMIVVVIAILIATPQGRAWAQEVVRFFTRINGTTAQLSEEGIHWMDELGTEYELPLVPVFIPNVPAEMRAISGCETPQKAESYDCQVALAESRLGFDLKELPEKPVDWDFKFLSFELDSHTVRISYDLDFSQTSYSHLVLMQGTGDFPGFGNNPWEAVPADKIESVSIGIYKGEYVKGRFSLRPGNDVLTWSDGEEHRLVWSEGTGWYLIEFWPNLNLTHMMGREELIHLAESLVDSPVETIEDLNPDLLLSIADAEKISGLDLKAPTLLPMDMDFSHARYSSNDQKVQLVYGMNEELTIRAWKGVPVDFKKPLGQYEFTCESVNIRGDDAYYCARETPSARSFLWWHQDGLNYQMDYEQLLGGRVDREKMILIAESMQDVDDFRKRNMRSYEQAVIHAQALGIEFKNLAEAPEAWMFDYFWSDIPAQCINLVYKAAAGQDMLSINQCKTDKRSDISVFPLWAIERVEVGNTSGQYIGGDFVMTEDGKQIWDPTAPRKQLYWQQDGLWMQLSIYGNKALLLDKETLVTYAESLK
jgi:hypothetical protein